MTDNTKQLGIICDLDGTIALLNGRSPYDASTCEQDLVNKPIAKILENYPGLVVFCSGRYAKHRPETIRWIDKNLNLQVKNYALHMRRDKDNRKDSIIKSELYHGAIKPNYAIEFVLDDRQQVVDMWREEGLTCLQVAPGNF